MNDFPEKGHYLYPGNLFASKTPYIVTTVLGSCISVCMWDRILKIGGINHYMLALWNGEGLATPKYGNIAISKLYEKLLTYGCKHQNIRAKVFGGAEVINVTSSIMNIGQRNADIAFDMLKSLKIPVVSSDVGGKVGRKLIYNTQTGSVLMKKLKGQINDIKT